MRIVTITILLSMLMTTKVWSQDAHFSQNYAAPLFINPAMTGIMNGDVRVGAIYRNQWSSVMPGAAFKTITASADMAFKGIGTYDRAAVGVMIYNDKAGVVSLNTTRIDIAAAYNVGLNENTFFSLGLEGGVMQKGIDLSQAEFGESEEVIENTSIWRGNVAGGALFYTAKDARTNMYFGLGMYHLTRPNISYTDITKDQVNSKLSFQLGGSVAVARSMDIVPSVYYIKQLFHHKLEAGSFLRFIFDYDRRSQLSKAFNIGSWLRLSGGVDRTIGISDLVVAAKVDYDNISAGLSYDFTLSELGSLNGNRGGVELAVIYTLQRAKRSGPLHCPRF